ncbi:MAG: M28 family peptidase [Flavobacteriales bacterium]
MLKHTVRHCEELRRSKLLLFLFFPVIVFAQNQTAIRYSQFITAADIKQTITVLASDSLEGRETGQPGQVKAANYIAKQYENFGLPKISNGYFQKYVVRYVIPNSINITVNRKELSFKDDFYHKSDFLNDTLQSEYVTFYKWGDVITPNAIVFTNEQEVDGDRLHFLKKNGAKAIFIIQDEERYKAGLKSIVTKSRKSNNYVVNPEIPIFYITEKAFKKVFRCKSTKAKSKVHKMKCELKMAVYSVFVQGENVLGFVEGSDLKNEVVVVSAHYDHLGKDGEKIYYGADDNASGTSAIIAVAKAFAQAKKEGNGPRRSILFISFSGEEMGLLGSSYYSEHPVFPLENTVADLNIDMIGRIDNKHDTNPNYIYLIGSDKLSSDLHNISDSTNRMYSKLDLDYTFNDPNDPNQFYYRSDHYNFAKHNIPVIFYFNGVHEDYHRTTDTVDKINFDKVEKISKLVFFTAWELANRDKRIVVDKVNEFKSTR